MISKLTDFQCEFLTTNRLILQLNTLCSFSTRSGNIWFDMPGGIRQNTVYVASRVWSCGSSLDDFVRYLTRKQSNKAQQPWRLLIFDVRGSHVTGEFIGYCFTNEIYLLTYPPHTTHSLQPLDVSVFSQLVKAYSDRSEEFLHES